MRSAAWMFVVVSLLGASVARAQDTVGLAMGYPATVAVIWPVAGWLALRPDFSIARSAGDLTTTTSPQIGLIGGQSQTVVVGPASLSSSSTETWQTAVGVSALLYVGRWQALRTYVSPRFSYARSTDSTSSAGFSSDSRSSTYSAGGSFGAQYSLVEHFGLFGEIGLHYARTTTNGSAESSGATRGLIIVNRGTTAGVNTRSSVGVIFFF